MNKSLVSIFICSVIFSVGNELGFTQEYNGEREAANWIISILEAGEDPNMLNEDGDSPLMLALRFNNLGLTRALLQAGADPNLEVFISEGLLGNRVTTPLLEAMNRDSSSKILEVLFRAADDQEWPITSSVVDGRCGVEQYTCGRGTPIVDEYSEEDNSAIFGGLYSWSCEGINGGRIDICFGF